MSGSVSKDRQLVFTLKSLHGRFPLSLLANVFQGIQKTVYLLAMDISRYEAQKRIRVPQEIKKLCELEHVLEREGSYEVIAQFPVPEQLILMPEFDIGMKSREKFLKVISLLSEDSHSYKFGSIIQDHAYRKKIIKTIESFCPKADESWQINIRGDNIEPGFSLTSGTRKKIEKLLEPEIETAVITGELIRLHLDENRIGIFYYPSKRVLDCYYKPEIEDLIMENLKDLIQVKGTVQLNERGEPEKIVDVYDIIEVDLRPLKLNIICGDNITLKFKKTFEIQPVFNQDIQEFEFNIEDFNILATGN